MKNPNNLTSTNSLLVYHYELKAQKPADNPANISDKYLATGRPNLTLLEEKRLRIDSATTGAEIALNRIGLLKDEISQNEAFRIYGRAVVESWLNTGYVTRVKGGSKSNSKIYYSRIELETVADLWKKRKLK